MQTKFAALTSTDDLVPYMGKGLSYSSCHAVFRAAGEIHAGDILPSFASVAQRAVEIERRANAGRCVATQDVLAIVHGGMVAVHTAADGGFGVARVSCSPTFVSEHVLLAVNPAGVSHDVPTLLADLFQHPRRRKFVAEFSRDACAASAAVQGDDPILLADAVNRYRHGLDAWSGGVFCDPIRKLMDEFENESVGLLGWKPPGAGGAESVALIVDGSRESYAVADRFFRERGWLIGAVEMTEGLAISVHANGAAKFSAGLRLDLVGAADLGRDPAIAEDGLCLALAIAPRLSARFPAGSADEENTAPAPAWQEQELLVT